MADVPAKRPVLRIDGVSKTFPGTKALDGVTFDIAEGEIHALIGQNGSGKSTLIKILAGYHAADPGSRASLDEDALDLAAVGVARHDRLRFLHQDLGLFLELGAADNIALRTGYVCGRGGRVRWRRQIQQTRDLLAAFDVQMDMMRPLGELTPLQRTIVAIAAALVGWEDGGRVLVLDEPTAVLPPADVHRLLEIVELARERGTSVLYVSHRLDEVVRIADQVTVLREGAVVTTRGVAGLSTKNLAELMAGSDVDVDYRAHLPSDPTRPVVLRVRGVRSQYLGGLDLDLREGEVVGLAGLPGSGRAELPYAVAGLLPKATGRIQLGDGPWSDLGRSSGGAIPLVPADRGKEGTVVEFNVRENLSLAVLDRVSSRGVLHMRAERHLVQQWTSNLAISAPSPEATITTLSGGNQQKVVIARCLARQPRVMVLCEPTAGVDVKSRQAIYELVAERARQGLAMLLTSSDTGDLLALCTRVIVMAGGRAVRELTSDAMSESTLQRAMEEVEAGRW